VRDQLRITGDIRTSAAAIALVLAFLLIYPALAADMPSEVTSGSTVTFTAQNLSQDDLIIEWRASQGSPLTASGTALVWTAPAVSSPQSVSIVLTLYSPDGCSRTYVKSLQVVSRSTARIGLIKDCRFSSPARIGDQVTYTYNISNLGDLPLSGVNLSDAQNWGPDCRPAYTSGDDGDGILERGESWWYECRYTIADPDDYLLRIMDSKSSSASMAGTIDHLLEMRGRLEIMMEGLRRAEGRFDKGIARLTVSPETQDGRSYTNYSYINEVTGESLCRIVDGSGNLNRSIYYDPVPGAVLSRQQSAAGKMLSEVIYYPPPETKEYLKIEYDIPAKGYRTYTIIDYKTGDTLLLVVDSLGNILNKEYRITPGYKPYEERYFLKNTATVTAASEDGTVVSDRDSYTLEVLRPMPILSITKIPQESIVNPGDTINYTILYENIGHADAQGVVVREIYDKMLSILWAEPPPDPGTVDRWTVQDLRAGETGIIRISTVVSPDATAGSQITNKVEIAIEPISSNSSVSVVNTTVSGSYLNISKEASREVISPDDPEPFSYTIKYGNFGKDRQQNVTIHDWLDQNVEYIGFVAHPSLAVSLEGEHLQWYCGDLDAGQEGTIEIKVKARSRAEMAGHGNATSIVNRYRIDSSNKQGTMKSLETLLVRSLWINKTTDRRSYNPDENITYLIKYGNSLSIPASSVAVTDILPQVDFIDASPAPTSINGHNLTWTVRALEGGAVGAITLTVHIPRGSAAGFSETSSVRGEGYVYSRKGFSTEEKVDSLVNTVTISGYYGQSGHRYNDSSRAIATIAGYAGTQAGFVEHGSGQYQEDSQSSMNQANRSVYLQKDIFAAHKATEFSLPGNRSIKYASTWSEQSRVENRVLGDIVTEKYTYGQAIDRNSSFHADMNETVYDSEGDFTSGLFRMSYKKQPACSREAAQEIDENYHGSFRIEESLDSYGESVKFAKAAKGKGFVSSDKRAAGEQRSYESGSGYYSSQEEAQQQFVEKDMKAIYAPTSALAGGRNVNYSGLWSEGMWTAHPGKHIILSEAISQAVSLDMEAAMEKTSLSMLGEFNGTLDLDVQAGAGMGVEQRLLGAFQTDTAISIYSAPRHLYSHVNVSQNATMLDEQTALFWINVTNDGNKKLGRINVTDILPEGLDYINSSIRPKAKGQMINWSIPSLEISRTLTIKLRARINSSHEESGSGGYVNFVRVRTVSGESILEAVSSLFFEAFYQPLPCCPANAKAANASAIFKAAVVRDNWGDWNPSPCFALNGSMTECSALRDEYYDELEKNMTQCCASNYEVP